MYRSSNVSLLSLLPISNAIKNSGANKHIKWRGVDLVNLILILLPISLLHPDNPMIAKAIVPITICGDNFIFFGVASFICGSTITSNHS